MLVLLSSVATRSGRSRGPANGRKLTGIRPARISPLNGAKGRRSTV
ncbi:phage DNA packaging protein J [Pseudomonas lini]|nr:phage DNA packaging protein J [Pseudomonas lini]